MKTIKKDKSPWYLGVFYYNKEDKRLFLPKRTKLGWTVNFANPYSVLAMLLVVLGILGLSYLLK